MSNYGLYDVYCVTEDATYKVTSFTTPTECPINAGHTINTPTLVDEIELIGKKSISISAQNVQFNKAIYKDIGSDFVFNATNMSEILKVDIIGYMESGAGGYDVKIVDVTNDAVIATGSFSNVDICAINSISFRYTSTVDSIIEIHAKVTNAGNNATIKNATFYYN
jgi:hypothetical protein